MSPLQRLARRFGYELMPLKKSKAPNTQLAAILAFHGITLVLDVGANTGQYGRRLRDFGYRGRILSFEPLASAHAALETAAAVDPSWEVAPPMALGDEDGVIEIEVSDESDMSSILPQNALLRRISPSSRIIGREQVDLRRLDSIAGSHIDGNDRVFLKIDAQGFEPKVLDGAAALLPRLRGIQLEMSLVPLYDGALEFRAMIARLDAAGFSPHLFLPGYFERKLARQLEIDGVFMRDDRATDDE